MLLVLWAASGPAAAQKRLALVVGINDYNPTLRTLSKAVPDARDAAAALRLAQLGYEVELLDKPEDTTFAAVRAAWVRLLQRLGKGDVLLFYFAGHGIELDGHNYFLMSDTRFIPRASNPDAFDGDIVKLGSLDFQRMLDELGRRQKETNAVGLFIIDACREKPELHASSRAPDAALDLDVSNGLAPVRPPSEVFVMYSAGIGQTALDGEETAANSVYARFLLPLLKDPSLSLADLAQRVRRDVYPEAFKHDAHIQTPAYYDQLRSGRTIHGDYAQPEKIEAASASLMALRGMRARDTLIECAVCPEMVIVGAGSAHIGAADADADAAANEKPRQKVEFASRFAIGKFEVTNLDWTRCVDDGGCKGEVAVRDYTRRLKPVTHVSWDAAQKYIAWLNTKVPWQRYRLPTEAEWEFAARGGSDKRFSFGSEIDKLCLYANGADLSVGALLDVNVTCSDDVGREAAQVGSYLPNRYGLHDMVGNVWEWVQDCWHPTHAGRPADGRRAREPADPKTCSNRVARGGSWRSGPLALRTTVRHYFPQAHSRATLGFRVARDIAPDEQ